MIEYKKSPDYFSSWEMGECTDKNIIFLNLRGNTDKRYSHFHISKQDVKLLISDLQTLLSNKDERIQLKIKYNTDITN